jgi:hypothetical protein
MTGKFMVKDEAGGRSFVEFSSLNDRDVNRYFFSGPTSEDDKYGTTEVLAIMACYSLIRMLSCHLDMPQCDTPTELAMIQVFCVASLM